MLSHAALRAVRTIVNHDDCPDGVASAILLHDALPDAEIEFIQYGTDAHRSLVPRPGMLFCDFSPMPQRAAEFASVGTIVLDHHRTARDVVASMGENGIFGDERNEPGVCGAVLAYRHVWLPLRGETSLRGFAEHFANVAGVRDTWQTKSHLWGEAYAQAEVLLALPQVWWLGRPLIQIASSWEDTLAPIGAALVVKHEDRVRRAMAQAHRFAAAKGVRVVIIAGTALTSDAARLAGEQTDVIVGFDYGVQQDGATMRVSLRSEGGTFDCAAFATRHGGGGHTRAAGFTIVLRHGDAQPYAFIESLFAG